MGFVKNVSWDAAAGCCCCAIAICGGRPLLRPVQVLYTSGASLFVVQHKATTTFDNNNKTENNKLLDVRLNIKDLRAERKKGRRKRYRNGRPRPGMMMMSRARLLLMIPIQNSMNGLRQQTFSPPFTKSGAFHWLPLEFHRGLQASHDHDRRASVGHGGCSRNINL